MALTSEQASEMGKKSKRGVSERTKILNALFTEEKAKEVFLKLEQIAISGDMDAIKTYLAYCFGKPETKIDVTSDGEQLGTFDLDKLSVEQLNQLRIIKQSIETK
jgi:hypothetical protein